MDKALKLNDHDCELETFLNEHPEISLRKFGSKSFLRLNEDVELILFISSGNEILVLEFIYKGRHFLYSQKID